MPPTPEVVHLPLPTWERESPTEILLVLKLPYLRLVLGGVSVEFGDDCAPEYFARPIGGVGSHTFPELVGAKFHVLYGADAWLGLISDLLKAKIRVTLDPFDVPLAATEVREDDPPHEPPVRPKTRFA